MPWPATKRGTHLITAVDRLVLLSGEFQRIALSATVNPAERMADFVGGFRRTGTGQDAGIEKRPVSIIRSSRDEDLRYFGLLSRRKHATALLTGSWWPALIDAFKKIIEGHRSTLLFTNSRRTAEKVTRLINEGRTGRPCLSRITALLPGRSALPWSRSSNEGELKAIVATNSLELGIDIGSLDQVVLVQTPRSVSSAVQRIGRSGHEVGEKSRGSLFPTHGRDFLDAAVMARAILEQDIEEVRPVEAPLDILAQVILSMTAMERWDIDRLYAFLRTSYPYRDLARRQFDAVLDMLNGRYADTRLRELKGRVSLDRIDNTVQAHSEVPYLLYSSGGTIPERGYFDLRLQDSHAKIGELDEEFVWERTLGDTFDARVPALADRERSRITMSRSCRSEPPKRMVPFWRAEEQHRDFHLSEPDRRLPRACRRPARFSGASSRSCIERHCMEETAADELIGFLKLQKEADRSSLPHRHHLLIEHVEDPQGGAILKQIILHTFWGGRVNRPFALALAQAWEEREQHAASDRSWTTTASCSCPAGRAASGSFRLLSPETVEVHLRKSSNRADSSGPGSGRTRSGRCCCRKPGSNAGCRSGSCGFGPRNCWPRSGPTAISRSCSRPGAPASMTSSTWRV